MEMHESDGISQLQDFSQLRRINRIVKLQNNSIIP